MLPKWVGEGISRIYEDGLIQCFSSFFFSYFEEKDVIGSEFGGKWKNVDYLFIYLFITQTENEIWIQMLLEINETCLE